MAGRAPAPTSSQSQNCSWGGGREGRTASAAIASTPARSRVTAEPKAAGMDRCAPGFQQGKIISEFSGFFNLQDCIRFRSKRRMQRLKHKMNNCHVSNVLTARFVDYFNASKMGLRQGTPLTQCRGVAKAGGVTAPPFHHPGMGAQSVGARPEKPRQNCCARARGSAKN